MVFDFFAGLSGDVKGVHGDAFFGANACVCGVEVVLVDGAEEVVEQTDAVEALDFDGGAVGVQVVADKGAEWDGDAVVGAGFEEICLATKEFIGVVGFSQHDGFEGFEEALAGGGGGDGFEVGGADPEDVDHDAVGAGEEVGGEDVDLFGGEGAADFFEEEGFVAGCEDDFGVTFVGVIDPFDAGCAEVSFVIFPLEEMADGSDLGDDVCGLAEVEGGGGHALEVLFDVWVVVLPHDVDDLIAERDAVGVELEGVFFTAAGEEGASGFVELEHEAFLPPGPALWGGCVGVGEGEEEEGVEV